MRELALDDVEALAVGAWILGTGGGGSPYLGLLNMRRLYAEGRRVSLMSPLDLADEDWVAVVSNMGAPLVGQERLADSRNIARAVEIQQTLLGSKFRAVMPLEIGGSNGIQPLMAAAHLGLPVVDADTMGRVYPEAQMTSVAVGDLRPYPCVLYDPRGIEAVVTKVPSWKWMERVSRKICVELGSIASTCKAPRTGREVKDWGIHFTVTKAIAPSHDPFVLEHEAPIAMSPELICVLDAVSGEAFGTETLSGLTDTMVIDVGEIVHAKRIALHLRLVQEFRSDDNCRGAAGCFEADAVMHTARRARPSVADRGHHDVVGGVDGRDQRRVGLLGEALLAVVVHCGKGGFFLEFRHGLAQQAVGVSFGVSLARNTIRRGRCPPAPVACSSRYARALSQAPP
jgi:DUF917 family protein